MPLKVYCAVLYITALITIMSTNNKECSIKRVSGRVRGDVEVAHASPFT